MIFGSCKDITIGPTAIMALMTQKYVESHGPDFAVLLAFLSGVVIFIFGILRLGKYINLFICFKFIFVIHLKLTRIKLLN